MVMDMGNAIILCSGGLDSVVLAHYLKKIKKIESLKLVFLDYGQKALEEELFCVKKVAEELNADLKILDVKWLGDISTSLINKEVDEEKIKNINESEELISWYVPCRNALFLLIGLALAESEFISKNKKYDIYLGIKYEGELQFKDTTPEFLEQMNKTAEFCTQGGNYKFIAPFLEKEKEEVIKLGLELGVDLKNTYSCYTGGGDRENLFHCGICGGCKSRKKGFRFSGVEDVSVYKN
jgi:7-cyano-7-deazaguanine synthase